MKIAILFSIVLAIAFSWRFGSIAQSQEVRDDNLPKLQEYLSTLERRRNIYVEQLGEDHWKTRQIKNEIERTEREIRLRGLNDGEKRPPKTSQEKLTALRDKVAEMDEKQLRVMVQILADRLLTLEAEVHKLKEDKFYLLSQ